MKVREYEKEGNSLEEAIGKAVIYCRDHDILKEFPEKTARNALAEGLPIEFVQKITGLDIETIKSLQASNN